MGVPARVLKNYDMSCPKCGRLNCVRILRAYGSRGRPKEWSCHCEDCGRSFKPRKLPEEMSLVTGMNTSIAKSKPEDICFPPRPPEPPSEVKVYYMPMEEVIEKYGPPKGLYQRNYNGAINYRSIIAAINASAGPAEAADFLDIKLEDFQGYIRRYNIQPKYGLLIKEKEAVEKVISGNELAENMNDNSILRNENAILDNESKDLRSDAGQTKADRRIPDKLTRDWLAEELKVRSVEEIQRDFPSNINVKLFAAKWGLLARPRAVELLPREKLVEYKEQGMSDKEIMEKTGIANWDFYKLKEQYGLKRAMRQSKEETPDMTTAKEILRLPGAGPRYTVAQLVELREHMVEDIDDLLRIRDLVQSGEMVISERIIKLLAWYRNQYNLVLDLIDEAFEKTEITLEKVV